MEEKAVSREYEFIKECGSFFVVTLNGDFPACRPFGAIMEAGDKLYISTHDGNDAHKQLRGNGNMQIVAKKEGTREWLRITGIAKECQDISLKQRFMDECPVLVSHYSSADSEHFLMFQITITKTEFK
nr:pyridoxamine 5'-phosphate oxidase family protein [uncultured Blautia sp.]